MEYGHIGRFLLYPQKVRDRFSIEPIGALGFMRELNTKYITFSFLQFNSNDIGNIVSVTVNFLDYGKPPTLVKKFAGTQQKDSGKPEL